MNPKRIGFLSFEGVAASELTRAADVFAAATLDGGYGNRISCYQIGTIGFTSECFRAESGIAFWPDSTLETVSESDTIIVPGGNLLRRSLVSERIADWVLVRVTKRAALPRSAVEFMVLRKLGYSMVVKLPLTGVTRTK
jgi:transcriptional regulator GlxA family with amidase domain